MYQKHRKRRSELQRRHDILLHQSRRDPAAYQVATLQDFSETVKVYRERARAAEADTEHSKKLLISTQNQVAQLEKKLSLKESTTGDLLEVVDGREKELQKSAARCVELAVNYPLSLGTWT